MGAPARVLYVDDSRLDRELIRDALAQDAGEFALVEAATQREFEERLAADGFDLVLSDFNIRGFEGLQVIDAVRARSPTVPVVIVTGTGSEEVAVEAMKRGAADYVLKTPSHIQRLTLTLNKVLDRKRLEAEGQRLQRRLAEGARLESLGLMAGGVAHDFNNLLTGVIGHLELLRSELSPGSPAAERVGKIEAIAEQAAALCRQLLAYSGKGKLVTRAVDVNALIRDTLAVLQNSIGKHIRVQFEPGERLPVVTGDVTQLRQVVMNLVLNAAEAIGDQAGLITIATAQRPVRADDLTGPCPIPDPPAERYVIISVTDTGMGMNTETVTHIFDPFVSTKRAGRGLGLAATMGIVRGHRGLIRVESEPDHGTTFTVCLPAGSAPAGSAPSVALPATGPRILVVDDESSVCHVMTDALAAAGFQVHDAADGHAALARLSSPAQPYALVVLDLTLPGLSGIEVLKRLRENQPQLPAILISGYHADELGDVIQDPAVVAVLQKPFAPHELIAAVRRALSI